MPCSNLLNHAECDHGGWAECSTDSLRVASAARRAANHASHDLGLDTIRLRYFKPGPNFHWDPLDPGDADFGMITLHIGPFDHELLGKACHPEKTELPTVWSRAGLARAYTALVVLHEARHVWQMKRESIKPALTSEAEESDAQQYMWQAIQTQGFSRRELAELLRNAVRVD